MSNICFAIGHGITDDGRYNPGAVNGNYHEFKIAKEIGRYAQEYFNKNYSEKAELMNYNGTLTLEQRIDKLQGNTYDFVAEIHLNAGGGTGVECYHANKDAKGQKYADAICDNIAAALGIPQRKNWTDADGGDKVKLNEYGTDYFGIIREVKPTAVLVEVCFIDTQSDLDKVKTAAGQKKCGEAIAKAIASVRGLKKKTTTTAKKLYRVRKSWKDVASQTGAFSVLDNAIAQAKKDKLNVYDSNGKEVYTYKATTKAVTKGCKVKVKKGAKDYNGNSVASFVYNNVYKVDELNGKRAVLDLKGICTAFHINNLIVQ